MNAKKLFKIEYILIYTAFFVFVLNVSFKRIASNEFNRIDLALNSLSLQNRLPDDFDRLLLPFSYFDQEIENQVNSVLALMSSPDFHDDLIEATIQLQYSLRQTEQTLLFGYDSLLYCAIFLSVIAVLVILYKNFSFKMENNRRQAMNDAQINFSRDLHDGVAQDLAAMKIYLKKNDVDKTNFYGTQGGQVGDSGELRIGADTVVTVAEAARAGNIVIHKGTVQKPINVGDQVVSVINPIVREQTTRAHTATHLLQAALRRVLNTDVEQRGSRVAPDSVRFDFSFGRAMTDDEKTQVENIVNDWIAANMDVKHEEMSLDAAKSRGAMALFGEKYGDVVRVITAGDVSCELCGGTHVYHTGEIIRARINKEKSVASGIRRITMSVGNLAE